MALRVHWLAAVAANRAALFDDLAGVLRKSDHLATIGPNPYGAWFFQGVFGQEFPCYKEYLVTFRVVTHSYLPNPKTGQNRFQQRQVHSRHVNLGSLEIVLHTNLLKYLIDTICDCRCLKLLDGERYQFIIHPGLQMKSSLARGTDSPDGHEVNEVQFQVVSHSILMSF
jgi:hypothetical protein